jgi:PAS domain-containing protein
MRQWELIGITDSDPFWTPPKPADTEPEVVVTEEAGPTIFFWSTDATLRMRSVSAAAADALGLPVSWCEGRDLLDVFGLDGPNLAALEAHVGALSGEASTFTLRGERDATRCHVAPTHGADGRVSGTFCIASPEPATEELETALERVRVA